MWDYNSVMIEYGIVGLLVLIAFLHVLRRIARSAQSANSTCGGSCACGVSRPGADRLGRRIELVQLNSPGDANLPSGKQADAHRAIVHG